MEWNVWGKKRVEDSTNGRRDLPRAEALSGQKPLMPFRLVSGSVCDWCLPLNAAQTSWCTSGVQGYKCMQSPESSCTTHTQDHWIHEEEGTLTYVEMMRTKIPAAHQTCDAEDLQTMV